MNNVSAKRKRAREDKGWKCYIHDG